MTLDELAATLPHGFHDAEVNGLRIDYIRREVTIDLAVWVGDLWSDEPDERECYRPGSLILSGLHFCCIEPPSPDYPSRAGVAVTIDTGSVESLAAPPAARLPRDLPAGSFTNWFFVNEWNAFIYIAASHASLRWQVEIERRSPAYP